MTGNRKRRSRTAAVIDMTSDDAQIVAHQVASHRITKKTKKIYAGKLNKWASYFTDKFPLLISESTNSDGDVIVSVDVERLEVEHVNSFLGQETKDAIEVQNTDLEPGTTEFLDFAESRTVYAYQTISGHVSALKDAYKDAGVAISPDIKKCTDEFLQGYKKIIADLKAQGKYKMDEGKSHIRFAGFVQLIKLFSQYSPYNAVNYLKRAFEIGIFCVLFIVLCWNLAQRSETVANIHLEHMHWVGDALCVRIPKSKNDQAGDKSDADDDGKHVYANPSNPLICPISNLAVYFFTTPRTCNKLFEGSNQQAIGISGLAG